MKEGRKERNRSASSRYLTAKVLCADNPERLHFLLLTMEGRRNHGCPQQFKILRFATSVLQGSSAFSLTPVASGSLQQGEFVS